MKKYQILKHPDNRMLAVKEGFSFPGVIFGGVWLLWHKMWVLGGVACVIGLAAYVVFPNPEGVIMGIPYGHKFGMADITNICIEIVVGIFGNEWRSSSLRERGFECVTVVKAENPDSAKAKYIRQDMDELSRLG